MRKTSLHFSAGPSTIRLTRKGTRARSRYLVFLLSLLFAASCKENDAISNAPVRGLSVFCSPAGANVSCAAYLRPDGGNITAQATWLVVGPAVGNFAEPGLFVPTGPGDVGLWAQYQELFSAPPFWYFVNPPEPARVLLGFSGVVREEGTNAGIPGAEVRILAGHFAGARVMTNSVGVYFVERILSGETFSLMASKEGYEPSTKLLRIDYPLTDPRYDSDFVLRRLS